MSSSDLLKKVEAIKKKATLVNTNKDNEINDIDEISSDLVNTHVQQNLFLVERQIEFGEVEMGVLESGIPYLTIRGLAKMCGVDHSALFRLTTNWGEEKYKPRGKVIHQLLESAGYTEPTLYLKAEFNGVQVNAYTEPVCIAILEYYAFLAEEKREKAIQTFRVLARTKFREFVYQAVGYSPDRQALDSWKHFHDRVDLNIDSVPDGFFSVFKEISGMIVALIRSEIVVSDRVVPDLSVGKVWSIYWTKNNLDLIHGDRVKYDHNYPEYYRQALSNPQESWAYPDSALPAFRSWFKQTYLASKFPQYMISQASKGQISRLTANKAIEAITGKSLQPPKKKK
jgi:hypothetical protein